MLTHEDILQVAAWKDRVGERRPGFLHDHAHNFHGPVSAAHSVAVSCPSEQADDDVLNIAFVIESDPETKELRMVRK